jgi:hypothetical protein
MANSTNPYILPHMSLRGMYLKEKGKKKIKEQLIFYKTSEMKHG